MMKNIVRHKIIPAVFLVLFKEQHILLQRRINTGHGDGQLSLVGGHVEQNESAKSALIREAMEEIGISIKPQNAECTYVLYINQEGEERIDIFFRVSKWQGKISICEPDKCSELAFFSVDQLPKDTLSYIRFALENIMEGRKYGEVGWKQ